MQPGDIQNCVSLTHTQTPTPTYTHSLKPAFTATDADDIFSSMLLVDMYTERETGNVIYGILGLRWK